MKPLFLFFFLTLLTYCSHGQIITTIAGNGGTTLGDGGPAVNAALDGPYDVAVDAAGNIYVTDGYHDRIRKIDHAGNITTIAGTGVQGYNGDNIPATAAQLFRPVGLAFSISGDLYFCDAFNNRVRKIDAAGIITTVAGNGTTVYNGDNIAATAAAIYAPHWVAFDLDGNMYITDYGNHRVRKVNSSGILTTIAGTGMAGNTGDNGPATDAEVNGVYGIAIDDTGNIYFTDVYENVVRKIDGNGIITRFAGNPPSTVLGDGGPADQAMLNGPIGIVIDAGRKIYITDTHNERIRKVEGGYITTIAGDGTLGFGGDNGPATDAQFRMPAGITQDRNSGVIYFTDFGNNRVRRIGWPDLVNDLDKIPTTITVYPNPSAGLFKYMITAPGRESFTVSVVDITGRQVLSAEVISNQLQSVKLSQPPGLYFLSACSHTKSAATQIIEIR